VQLRSRLDHTAKHLPKRFTAGQRFAGPSHETGLCILQSHDRIEIARVEVLFENLRPILRLIRQIADIGGDEGLDQTSFERYSDSG
jgi:hypothetical protein